MIKKSTITAVLNLGLILTLFSSFNAQATDIRTPMVFPGRDGLVLDIVKLALNKSSVTPTFIPAEEYLTDARVVEETRTGNIDLIWAGASSELQNQLRAIKIPIFKGLSGYRTFVIEESTQNQFNHIQTLAQLNQRKAGLGRFWSDTKILEAAGMEVIQPVKAESLFHMVDGGRFDYIPLAVHESQGVVDMQNNNNVNLVVEENLLLVYPSAMYLYVSKDNERLYNNLNHGLEQAIADGSFDELFYNSELITRTFATSNIHERVAIHIDNPFLPHDVPLEREELWLDINR
ncbi:hypothetical protein [Vibrio sp. WXL210]|uniref:hypothetical protein n=1 Tax=Vibrio sp. WXL210 TaxID=3450709 RepID=UPI003EC8FF1E